MLRNIWCNSQQRSQNLHEKARQRPLTAQFFASVRYWPHLATSKPPRPQVATEGGIFHAFNELLAHSCEL
ncbi:hypothetical protein N7495_000522 [Penicillium taxi]|uniref:uncharacterized protein n=1 Tax=Penicillium taxi TaxID=168475 RepID=UPI0025456918|nr:uncharacterized protein N7495_000522 [Penicillium taxi]KAJ5907840.1 hypothetical protein N7495_000522 [Penicillium taxi]